MNWAVVSFGGYTAILLAVGVWSYRIVERVPIARYEEEFYAAGRGLGGVLVALVIAGALASAGTFIATPGMCYAYGYCWVFINNLTIFMHLLSLLPIGIAVGIVARRVNATTYLDLLKARYPSKTIVIVLSILVTLFLLPYMAIQFVAAARVTTQMTGMGYLPSLALGSLVVLTYCVAGGMRGTSLALLVQGLAMTLGCALLFVWTVRAAGGFQRSTEILAAESADLLSPTGGGQFSPIFVFSLACLAGYFIVGMPHVLLGALTYKNSRALKSAVWMGGILVFAWNIMLSVSATLGRAILPDLPVADEINPWLAMHVMPEALGGIVLAGIVAAIQTTVAPMAIVITSSIAKNLVRELRPAVSEGAVKRTSRWTMVVCLALAIGLALFQPKFIQWIILFSMGGLEAATFGPILLGMFWKRGNQWGTMVSIVWGTIIYVLANTVVPQIALGGTHPSLVSVASSLVVYVLVSSMTPGPPPEVVRTFWGRAPRRRVSAPEIEPVD